jgi:hypothetical protein
VKKNKADVYQPSGDVRRVQSLNGGRHVRVGDHVGKWHHLSVEGDADDIATLVESVFAVNPELAVRIVDELVGVNSEFEGLRPLVEGDD